jgi:hypothetical protein
LTPEAQELLNINSDLSVIDNTVVFNKIRIVKETNRWHDETIDLDLGKTIGFLVSYHTFKRALWLPDENERKPVELIGTKIPACSAYDGEHADTDLFSKARRCSECDFSKWGSKRKFIDPKAGKKTQACKQIMALAGYLIPGWFDPKKIDHIKEVLSGEAYAIFLPPSSIGSAKNQDGKYLFSNVVLKKKQIRYNFVIRKLTLKKTEGGDFSYSVANVENAEDLTKMMISNPEVLNEYARGIKKIKTAILNKEWTLDDYMQGEDIDADVINDDSGDEDLVDYAVNNSEGEAF